MRHKMTFSHFSKGFIRPNLGEESGGAYLQVSGFKRQVPIHFVPLSQGDEEQSSGGGMQNGKGKAENGKLIAHRSTLTVLFYYIPPPLRFTQRRNRDCDPQRVQNDI